MDVTLNDAIARVLTVILPQVTDANPNGPWLTDPYTSKICRALRELPVNARVSLYRRMKTRMFFTMRITLRDIPQHRQDKELLRGYEIVSNFTQQRVLRVLRAVLRVSDGSPLTPL